MIEPCYTDAIATVYHGDCLEVMRQIEAESIDAIVTDPPAGIAFMGKKWDHDKGGRAAWIAWMTEVAAEALRLLKPGGHALVWALPKTSHWTATAWEDAGWELREKVYHLFGSGFPKSLTLGNGRGTALKPACEEWLLLRKPLSEKTIAANVVRHGTGGLNIDACRMPTGDNLAGAREGERRGRGRHPGWQRPWMNDPEACAAVARSKKERRAHAQALGRHPATVIHDGSNEVVEIFPVTANRILQGIDGSAARFFYCAKASRADREEGMNGAPLQKVGTTRGEDVRPGGLERLPMRANTHPTVKSTPLMRYLCRLITPPGGIILDPFAGSGSTGKAARQEGFSSVLIEREAEYIEIIKRRVRDAPGRLPT